MLLHFIQIINSISLCIAHRKYFFVLFLYLFILKCVITFQIGGSVLKVVIDNNFSESNPATAVLVVNLPGASWQ